MRSPHEPPHVTSRGPDERGTVGPRPRHRRRGAGHVHGHDRARHPRPLGPVRRRAGPVRRQRGAPHRRADRHDAGRRPRRVASSSTPTRSSGWSTWCGRSWAPTGRSGWAWARSRSTCSPWSPWSACCASGSGPGSSAPCTGRRTRSGRSRWRTRSATAPTGPRSGCSRLAAACAAAVVAAVGWRLTPSYARARLVPDAEEAPVMTLTLATQRLLAGLDHGPAPRLDRRRAGRPGRGVRADRARRRRVPDGATRSAGRSGAGPVVVGNAMESESLSHKDAVLLRTAPGLVLDGLEILAVRAAGAPGPARRRPPDRPGPVREQVAVRRSPVEVRHLDGGFVAGQESALVNRLDGRPGLPGDPLVPVTGSAGSTAGRRWSSTPRPSPSSRCWRGTAPTGSAASARPRTPAPSWSPSPARPVTSCPGPAWSRSRGARRCGTC